MIVTRIQKTRPMVLSGSERIATISLAVLTQFQRVTDGWTDRHQKYGTTMSISGAAVMNRCGRE